MSEGTYPLWEKQVLLPLLRDFCAKEEIYFTSKTLLCIVPGGGTAAPGSVLAQSPKSYSRYRQVVSGISQEVTKVNHIPLLPSLLMVDKERTMKHATRVDRDITTVRHVDDEMVKVIKRSVQRQQEEKVQEVLLPSVKNNNGDGCHHGGGISDTGMGYMEPTKLATGVAADNSSRGEAKRRCVGRHMEDKATNHYPRICIQLVVEKDGRVIKMKEIKTECTGGQPVQKHDPDPLPLLRSGI